LFVVTGSTDFSVTVDCSSMITQHDLDTTDKMMAQSTEICLKWHLIFSMSNTTCHGNVKSLQHCLLLILPFSGLWNVSDILWNRYHQCQVVWTFSNWI